MIRRLFVVLSVVAGPPAVSAQERSADDALRRAAGAFPTVVDAAVSRHALPSVTVAVVHDQEVVFSAARGVADRERDLAAAVTTIYPVASITKLFTTTMLAQLVEKGTVTLDTTVKSLVPEFEVTSPFPSTQPTTLRQLATHTSGLPRDARGLFWNTVAAGAWSLTGARPEVPADAPRLDVLESLSSTVLATPPNERFGSYSNLGFQVLGVALERAAGMPYAEYVEARILRPLGMKSSGFELSEEQRARAAAGYVRPLLGGAHQAAPPRGPQTYPASGALYSTAPDLARFVSLQFREGAVGQGQILSADSLRMLHWQSMDWAFRWDAAHPTVDHSGGMSGFASYVGIIPSLKVGVVVLTNSCNLMAQTNPPRDLGTEILTALKEALSVPSSFDPSAVDLARYAGEYALANGTAEILVELTDTGLVYELPGLAGSRTRLIPIAPHSFASSWDPSRRPSVEFHASTDGTVSALSFATFRFERVVSRDDE